MNKILQSLLGVCMVTLASINISNPLYAQCELTLANAPIVNSTIESIWSSATSHSIQKPFPNAIPSGFSAKWRSLYTSANIYFLVEVTKATAPYNGNHSDWWNDDAVEIYIDADDSHTSTYAGDYQFGFRYNDGSVIKTGANNPSTTTTGISYNLYVTAVGYNVELSIPWTLVATGMPTSGSKIGVEVAVDVANNSSGARETQMLTYDGSGHAYENPSLFGEITLSSCVVSSINNLEIDGSTTNISPNPYSNQTTLTLPAVGSYTVMVSDLKGRMVKEYLVENNDKAILTSEGMENGIYMYSVKNILSNTMYNGNLVVNK